MAINNNQNSNYSGYTPKTSDPASSSTLNQATGSSYEQSSSNYATQGQPAASSFNTGMSSSNYAQGASADNRGVNASPNQSAQSHQNFTASGGIENTVGQIVDQVFHALQPRIHDYVTHFASRLMNSSDINPRQIVRTARQRPMLTVGALVVLAIGVGFLFTRESSSVQPSLHELH